MQATKDLPINQKTKGATQDGKKGKNPWENARWYAEAKREQNKTHVIAASRPQWPPACPIQRDGATDPQEQTWQILAANKLNPCLKKKIM